MTFTGCNVGFFLSFRGLQWVLWETWGSTVKVPGEITRRVCSETSVSEKGPCEWRNSLKLSESLYPGQKRSKKEPSATAFSGCGGDSSRNESLEEEDAIQVELQGSELWKRFHDIGTEMIITKAGRFGSAQAIQGSPTVDA